MLTIRKTTAADLAEVMPIFAEARVTIAALGIDQWQNGYPAQSDIEADIRAGESYCVEEDGEIVGSFAFLLGGEPTYDVIDGGDWLTESDAASAGYAAIHRIAVKVAKRGSGISTAMIDYAVEEARANGKVSVRVDTHHGNVVMRRMLEKHGFEACGTIYLASGDHRVGYERIV